jgi:hypothetical protein
MSLIKFAISLALAGGALPALANTYYRAEYNSEKISNVALIERILTFAGFCALDDQGAALDIVSRRGCAEENGPIKINFKIWHARADLFIEGTDDLVVGQRAIGERDRFHSLTLDGSADRVAGSGLAISSAVLTRVNGGFGGPQDAVGKKTPLKIVIEEGDPFAGDELLLASVLIEDETLVKNLKMAPASSTNFFPEKDENGDQGAALLTQ